MTPREFQLKFEGWQEKEAWKVILNKRAMNEKKVTIDILLDRGQKATTPEETEKIMSELDDIFGQKVVN